MYHPVYTNRDNDMRLRVRRYASRLFTVLDDKSGWCAEASDLGQRPEQGPPGDRLYDNACDMGFEIEWPNGQVLTFFWANEYEDTDGWVYRELVASKPYGPRRVVIFHD